MILFFCSLLLTIIIHVCYLFYLFRLGLPLFSQNVAVGGTCGIFVSLQFIERGTRYVDVTCDYGGGTAPRTGRWTLVDLNGGGK